MTLTRAMIIVLLNHVRTLATLKEMRAFINTKLAPRDVILKEAYDAALELRRMLYNDADFGKDGKLSEIKERLSVSKGNYRYWSDFNAHRAGQTDGTRRDMYEKKTGAGDFYRAKGNYYNVLRTLSNDNHIILWETRFFRIRCTWSELYSYLREYNATKGIEMWFPISKSAYFDNTDTTLLRMQEWKTSRSKIAYLCDCPYNEKE